MSDRPPPPALAGTDLALGGNLLTAAIRRDIADLNRLFLQCALEPGFGSDPWFCLPARAVGRLASAPPQARERVAQSPFTLFELCLPEPADHLGWRPAAVADAQDTAPGLRVQCRRSSRFCTDRARGCSPPRGRRAHVPAYSFRRGGRGRDSPVGPVASGVVWRRFVARARAAALASARTLLVHARSGCLQRGRPDTALGFCHRPVPDAVGGSGRALHGHAASPAQSSRPGRPLENMSLNVPCCAVRGTLPFAPFPSSGPGRHEGTFAAPADQGLQERRPRAEGHRPGRRGGRLLRAARPERCGQDHRDRHRIVPRHEDRRHSVGVRSRHRLRARGGENLPRRRAAGNQLQPVREGLDDPAQPGGLLRHSALRGQGPRRVLAASSCSSGTSATRSRGRFPAA